MASDTGELLSARGTERRAGPPDECCRCGRAWWSCPRPRREGLEKCALCIHVACSNHLFAINSRYLCTHCAEWYTTGRCTCGSCDSCLRRRRRSLEDRRTEGGRPATGGSRSAAIPPPPPIPPPPSAEGRRSVTGGSRNAEVMPPPRIPPPPRGAPPPSDEGRARGSWLFAGGARLLSRALRGWAGTTSGRAGGCLDPRGPRAASGAGATAQTGQPGSREGRTPEGPSAAAEGTAGLIALRQQRCMQCGVPVQTANGCLRCDRSLLCHLCLGGHIRGYCPGPPASSG